MTISHGSNELFFLLIELFLEFIAKCIISLVVEYIRRKLSEIVKSIAFENGSNQDHFPIVLFVLIDCGSKTSL